MITSSFFFVCVTGMEKVNFSGGEPFLPERGKYLGELVRYCKQDLKLPSVTVVSNGSLIREFWFRKYGKFNLECEKYCPIHVCIIFRMAIADKFILTIILSPDPHRNLVT